MIRNYKQTGGFTMVELLISVFAISVLTLAMITMNDMTSRQQKRETFQNDVEKVLTFFRAIRSDAISNRQMGSVETDGGFGVQLEHYTEDSRPKLRVTRYVDNEDALLSGEPDRMLTMSGGTPVDHVMDQIIISAGWKFTLENQLPGTVTATDTINVIFVPPNADMIINNGSDTGDLRSVEIVFEFDGRKKRICMNRISRFFEILSGELCT